MQGETNLSGIFFFLCSGIIMGYPVQAPSPRLFLFRRDNCGVTAWFSKEKSALFGTLIRIWTFPVTQGRDERCPRAAHFAGRVFFVLFSSLACLLWKFGELWFYFLWLRNHGYYPFTGPALGASIKLWLRLGVSHCGWTLAPNYLKPLLPDGN